MAKSACVEQCGRFTICTLGLDASFSSIDSGVASSVDAIPNSWPLFRVDVDSIIVLRGLCLKNANERSQALQQFSRVTDDWFEGYGSPACERSNGGTSEHADCCTVLNSREKLQLLLPDILQMSIQCPFEDVRESLTNLLSSFRDRGMSIPQPTACSTSRFIPQAELIPVDTNDVERQLEFASAFVQNSQLDHVTQVMGFHPRYLHAFQAMRQFLLQGDGPLPFDQRHYIAIMAAARHYCSYIVYQSATAFLLCDGNPAWLRGLDHAPQRLRNLSELNKLMAHRPWLINKSHFEKLLKASDDSWSLSELMHAIVLMAHFHTLSSFVHGCGLMPEVCHIDGHYYGSSLTNGFPLTGKPNLEEVLDYDGILISKEGAIDILMERMQRLTREADKLQLSDAELLNNFQAIGLQCAELPAGLVVAAPKADITCFTDDEDFTYEDFAKRNPSDIPTFRVEDYSWEDQGYSLTSKLYQNMGDLLDNRFKIAYSLTYRTMGDAVDVDTSAFRRAIWYYVQTLYGIRHDDYDYSIVNQLLERDLKAYMKMVTCYPERITKRDYNSCLQEFKHSEKVHVNVMLMEARQQAEMLYTLRALTQYMT